VRHRHAPLPQVAGCDLPQHWAEHVHVWLPR
jgi:hypothetical protein